MDYTLRDGLGPFSDPVAASSAGYSSCADDLLSPSESDQSHQRGVQVPSFGHDQSDTAPMGVCAVEEILCVG